MQKRNSSDFILSTPQWSAICASEKGVIKHKLPDAVVDKRKIVVDPISKRRFYVCHMTSEREIYNEIKNKII